MADETAGVEEVPRPSDAGSGRRPGFPEEDEPPRASSAGLGCPPDFAEGREAPDASTVSLSRRPGFPEEDEAPRASDASLICPPGSPEETEPPGAPSSDSAVGADQPRPGPELSEPGPGGPPAGPLADIAASLQAPPAAASAAPPGIATRRVDQAWLGGVCAGLAARLGWPAVVIRGFFLASTLWLFSGAAVYGVLWLLLPSEREKPSVGVAAASRTGFRPATAPDRHFQTVLGLILALYGVGAAGLVSYLGDSWINTNALSIMGVLLGGALVWRQWDRAGEDDSVASGWIVFGKVTAGVVLAVGVIVVSLGLRLGWSETVRICGIASFALGVALFIGSPWFLHPEARAARREGELVGRAKADMAAHLHDSVLQTLAMIQRQSADAKAVAHLARRQERELRTWLYGDAVDAESLKAALRAVAAEIEDAYSVPIDIVTVGDAELTPDLDALVRAAREAILNAAKHSGADHVDVYAEAGHGVVEVFVRDRGRGFDAAHVAEDRMGIRGSILDRVQRHGGTVGLRSTVGEGTEVRLEMGL